jgi:hypothetical protein
MRLTFPRVAFVLSLVALLVALLGCGGGGVPDRAKMQLYARLPQDVAGEMFARQAEASCAGYPASRS